MKHTKYFSELKVNLKDAPKGVKQSFNNLVKYFDSKSDIKILYKRPVGTSDSSKWEILDVIKGSNSIASSKCTELQRHYDDSKVVEYCDYDYLDAMGLSSFENKIDEMVKNLK